MNITKKLKIDLQNPGSTPIIYAVQNDSNVRSLKLEMLNGRAPFIIPKNVRVVVRYNRADGSGGEFDTLSDDTVAWSARKNILDLDISPVLVSVPGSVDVTVTLLHGEQQLSVFPIRLHVDPVAAAPNAAPENYFYVTGFLPAPDSAEKGQYLCVSKVNSAGKVTAVEAVDAPAGSGGTVDEKAVQEIVDAYLAENPPVTEESDPTVPAWAKQPAKPGYTPEEIGAQPKGNYILNDQLPGKINEALALAKESGDFQGADGKSAYQYAQEAGYVGTEAEFAENLCKDTVWVNVTPNDDGLYSSDKSVAEIVEAYTHRQSVICLIVVDGVQSRIPLLACIKNEDITTCIFTATLGGADVIVYILSANGTESANYAVIEPPSPEVNMENLTIRIGSKTVVYNGSTPKTFTLDSVKNPHVLSLKAISYDGSAAVDITETVNSMIEDKLPKTLPNPNVLTINGIPYDGTAPVEITISGETGNMTESVLSDNLFDKSTVILDKGWYHSSSGATIVDSTEAGYCYVELRGSGTYRTKVSVAHHSENYAQRVPLMKEDKTWLQNITGTITDTGDRTAWDLEFTVTQDMIDAGAKYYTMTVDKKNIDTVMMVKDRPYPTEYIPYGYINSPGATNISAKLENVLYGKTALFLGDSICAGDLEDSEYTGWGWAGFIGEANSMTRKNYGRNGGTITPLASAVAESRDLSSQLILAQAEYPNADYIIFEGGTNDADMLTESGLGIVSGDYSTFDTATFSGAMESLILNILTVFPNARVGYIVAQKMGNPPYSSEENIRRKFFDRAVEICRKWGVPVIDLWNSATLNPALPYHAETFYTDGQHLTLAGYQKITPQIEAFMRNL